jgi:hypothetical protein
MTAAADMAERRARALALLFESGEAAVRAARGRLEAAESADEFAQAALALQRVSRSLRQTLALEDKLARAAERRAAAAEEALAKRRAQARQARRDQLSVMVTRAVWDEYEPDAPAEREDRLFELLDEEEVLDDFLDAPIEAQAERLCRKLDVTWTAPLPPREETGAEPRQPAWAGPAAEAQPP